MKLNFQDTFSKELPADIIANNEPRQVFEACFSFVNPKIPAAPQLVHVSEEMAAAIGLTKEDTSGEAFRDFVSGAKVYEGTKPYAMCYGGHQFGHWAGQLGDGRAINLGEVIHEKQPWALQLKGSGRTPYSRGADGLAVLRSSIREHLCSEAMHHLGVPTTRSLSLSLSGEEVLRDMMYDGNSAMEKGAIVCRTAPSFIRFGNFQIFASRGDLVNLKKLTDYTIQHFFKEIEVGTKKGYLAFFNQVMDQTLEMVMHWQRVGFVHGVMNTDNMSILGLTIDFGPYGWLENFDKGWTPNTTDRQKARYRYGNQPIIAYWNLFQLANAIYPLIEDVKPLEAALESYKKAFVLANTKMYMSKLGLKNHAKNEEEFINLLEETLELTECDMTIFFRKLGELEKTGEALDALNHVSEAFYFPETVMGNLPNVSEKNKAQWLKFIEEYLQRLQKESLSDAERKVNMDKVNPKYVLRNYMAQLAIDKADLGDYSLIEEFYQMLKKPYSDQPEYQQWFTKRPEWARHKVGCSMLSCSS